MTVVPGRTARERPGPGPDRSQVVGADVTPLARRAVAMMVLRVADVLVLTALGVLTSPAAGTRTLLAGVVFLAVTGLLTLGVLLPWRGPAVRSFGATLLVDGVFLQLQHESLGHALSVDVAVAAHLVAVCLLASFRTGLKIALWQSVLLLVAARGEASGLFPHAPAMAGIDRDDALLADSALLWLVVVTTSLASAINERELRRRRYDAEALAHLAGRLHGDEHPDDVAARLVTFAVEELDVPRALVCRRVRDRLVLVRGHGLAPARDGGRGAGRAPDGGPATASALLSLAARQEGPTLALRLDPGRDPWLAARLPQARRLIALPLAPEPDPAWLVLDLGSRNGGRTERRMVSTVAQAAATATLALSRAELLQRAEHAAATDALTGVANRRTFDATLERLMASWAGQGRPFALVLVAVDHLTSSNDRFGHQVGDEALQVVARVLAGQARAQDVPARYGGEEFALLLPDTDGAGAQQAAERVRLALHDVERPVRLTASFGVAAVPRDADSAAAVVAAADEALIHAKNTGRDRVVSAGTSVRPLPVAVTAGAPGSRGAGRPPARGE